MKSFALVVALAGCAFDYAPDVGNRLSAPTDGGDGSTAFGCSNIDGDPTVSVSFATNVRPLMWRSPGGCSPCHLGRVTSGLDLSSYESLRRGGLNSGTRIVIPQQPCDSILLQKIDRTPPFGSRMPFNGPPYFSATEVQLVRDWIAEGALDN